MVIIHTVTQFSYLPPSFSRYYGLRLIRCQFTDEELTGILWRLQSLAITTYGAVPAARFDEFG